MLRKLLGAVLPVVEPVFGEALYPILWRLLDVAVPSHICRFGRML